METAELDIEILHLEAGWKTVRFQDAEGALTMTMAEVLSDSFKELIIALYYMAGHGEEEDDEIGRHPAMTRVMIDVGKEEQAWITAHDPDYIEDSSICCCSKRTVVTEASFSWCSDIEYGVGSYMEWNIQKKPSAYADGMISIALRYHALSDANGTYSWRREWQVDLRRFSYIVCRALTHALETWGFTGWWRGAWTHDFQMNYFLWLKAFALHREEELDRGGSGLFQKELEILRTGME